MTSNQYIASLEVIAERANETKKEREKRQARNKKATERTSKEAEKQLKVLNKASKRKLDAEWSLKHCKEVDERLHQTIKVGSSPMSRTHCTILWPVPTHLQAQHACCNCADMVRPCVVKFYPRGRGHKASREQLCARVKPPRRTDLFWHLKTVQYVHEGFWGIISQLRS